MQPAPHDAVTAHVPRDRPAAAASAILALTGLFAGYRQTKRRLRESEARFRAVTEMSSDFYWESDAEHRLTQRGSAARKSSTVSIFQKGAQIGKRRWEVPYLSPDEAGWRAHRATLDAHQPFRDFELSRLGTDGSERYISISGDPVFDASGEFTGYRGVGSDITARKRAEHAMRESAEKLRRFADNVPAMTSPTTSTCAAASPQGFAQYFSFTIETILGKHLREVIGQDAYAEVEDKFGSAGGQPVTYQRARKLPSGEAATSRSSCCRISGNAAECWAASPDHRRHGAQAGA